MTEINNVIITGEAAKLPPGYAELIDPQKPLPASVALFEKRVTLQQMMGTVAFAIGFAVAGILLIIFGFIVLFSDRGVRQTTTLEYLPLFFGIVCLFAGWMMFRSLQLRRSLMRRQQNGEQTRLGIILTPEALFEVNEFGYCVVPRSQFRRLADGSVRYMHNGQEKSFRLPPALVSGDLSTLTGAINRWASGSR